LAACGDGADDEGAGDGELEDDECLADECVPVFWCGPNVQGWEVVGEDAGRIEAGEEGRDCYDRCDEEDGV
jgi:hypothetical protein